MEHERSRSSASVGPSASVAPAIVLPPAPLAPSASVASVTVPLASVPSVTPAASVPSVIPAASFASVIQPASVASVTPTASVASVISPRTHSPTVISDDEDTTVSHSPITISDEEEEEIVPVRRLPTVRHPQSLVDPQYGGDSDEETPISATQSHPQAESSGQVGGSKTQKRIEFDETDCRLVFKKALLCKTFTPQDEYADLDTVLYSFRDVIRRELVPILAEHPGVKAWNGLTNLYDYNKKRCR